MRKSKIAIIILMLISAVITCISFTFLDNIIPIHFGIDGKPDQFGSKYFLIIPTIILFIGCLSILLVCKYAKLSKNYQKYLLLTGIITESVMLFINVFMIIYSTVYKKDFEIDTIKLIMPLLGVMFIVLGNYMPKVEKNHTLGIRLSWSLYNEVTWQKTQRFGGFCCVIVGIALIIGSLIFNTKNLAIFMMSLVAIFAITTSTVSYLYYKQEKLKE